MGKKDGETEAEYLARKAAKKSKKSGDADTTEADEKAAKKAAKKAKKDKEAGDDSDKKAKKDKKNKREKEEAETEEDVPKKKSKVDDAPVAAAAAADTENNRVFVGNLPFSMTDDWIKEVFQPSGTVSTVEWLSHSDTGRFKGAGFLTMATSAEAAKAVADLNGKDCEGRPMKVELAAPRKAAPPGGFAGAGDVGEPSESVFCGNLSWSITEESLRAAFADCGTLTNIKWLEKDGEFKGIAFLDFDSVEAATKAVALAGTNIAGRPVRLNFSKKKEATPNKWGDKAGGAGGRTERPYKPQGEKPDGCVELFCGNLPWSIDEEKITAFFGGVGATVTATRWLNDKESGEFKGVGFVAFADTADVDKAVALGGENLDGRPIRIDYAGQKPKKEGAWQGGW